MIASMTSAAARSCLATAFFCGISSAEIASLTKAITVEIKVNPNRIAQIYLRFAYKKFQRLAAPSAPSLGIKVLFPDMSG